MGTFPKANRSAKPWTKQRIQEKTVVSEAGCWLWTGAIDPDGYGRAVTGSWYLSAHRVAYELWVGPIPAGLVIDHLCRVRNCVNPAHLEPVTIRENNLRGESPYARKARQTHCKNGHAFDAANTYYPTDGTRRCRACNSAAVARLKARKKGLTR